MLVAKELRNIPSDMTKPPKIAVFLVPMRLMRALPIGPGMKKVAYILTGGSDHFPLKCTIMIRLQLEIPQADDFRELTVSLLMARIPKVTAAPYKCNIGLQITQRWANYGPQNLSNWPTFGAKGRFDMNGCMARIRLNCRAYGSVWDDVFEIHFTMAGNHSATWLRYVAHYTTKSHWADMRRHFRMVCNCAAASIDQSQTSEETVYSCIQHV